MFGLVDWSFILTLVVILLGTLIGSYLRSSAKDRCLKDFDKFHITVEKKNGRVAWGEMQLTPTGFELVYRSDAQDDKHLETSYVVYKDEYGDIQAIYRYAQDLSEENKWRRDRELRRTFHPGLWRRYKRSLRNFFSTATDSLGDAIGFMIGRARKPAAQLITDTSQTYLTSIGKNIIGYAGTNYDPLLERYVGSRVVIEVVEDEEVHEHVGVLKEYSADFLELLDLYYPMPQKISLKGDSGCYVAEAVNVTMDGRQLKVANTAETPVLLESVSIGDNRKELSAIVGGGEEIVLHIDDNMVDVTLQMRVACLLDMIVPRSHGLIRHRAERYNPDTIFDLGVALVRRPGEEQETEKLRQTLRYNPHDAVSAARLGELLFRRGELEEAHFWLLRAREHCRQLPDNGARVAQNLRMLEHRLEDFQGLPNPNGQAPAIAAPLASDDGSITQTLRISDGRSDS